MLDSIKQMIKKQNAYMEASGLIFEDASGRNLDNEIVLGKYNPFTEAEVEEMEPVEEEGEDTTPDEGNDDIADDPIDGPSTEETPETIDSENIADEPIDNEGIEPVGAEAPMPLPGNDLPEPDPSQEIDPMANLISADIDLQSNTLRDILPIPPANAAEAIEGDTLDTHVDSGFGNSEPPSPTPVTSSITDETIEGNDNPPDTSDLSLDDQPIEDQPMSEAITLAGDSSSDSDQNIDPNSDPLTAAGAAADAAGVNSDTGANDNAPTGDNGENAVTSAVRDKVAETDSSADFSMGDDLDMGSSTSGQGASDLFKKLTDMSKRLEDIKADVFNQNKM